MSPSGFDSVREWVIVFCRRLREVTCAEDDSGASRWAEDHADGAEHERLREALSRTRRSAGWTTILRPARSAAAWGPVQCWWRRFWRRPRAAAG